MGSNDKLHKRNLKITNDKLAKFNKYSDKSKMPSGALKKFKSLQEEKQKYIKQKETGVTADPHITKEIKAKKGPIVKGPIVSKKELAASGLSLRDYLNKKQGKTRKHGDTLVKGTVASNYKTDGKKQRNMGVLKTSSDNKTTKDKNIKKIVTKKKINNKNTFSNDQNIKSKNKMVSKNTSGGIDEAKGDNSKPKKSMGSKIMGFFKGEGNKIKKDFKKAVKETKRNFGPGKNTLATKGTSNITNSSTYKKKVVPTKKKDSMGEEKIKPSKNMGMDSMMPSKKKKSNSVTYSSNGSKIKMSKGYSAGGKIFTGR